MLGNGRGLRIINQFYGVHIENNNNFEPDNIIRNEND